MVEIVRLLCRNHRFSFTSSFRNDCGHVRLRTRKVREARPFFLSFLRTVLNLWERFFRFTQDIEDMTGYRPGWYWQITWRFIGPCIMGTILVSSIVYRIIKNPTFSAWDAETVSSRRLSFSLLFSDIKSEKTDSRLYYIYRVEPYRPSIRVG